MSILGNIFLVLSLLITLVIISSTNGAKPPTSGDVAMGYPLGIILFNLAFLVCMSIVAVAIAWKDGFEWISANKSTRYALVVAGLLVVVLTGALSALFKYENHAPFSVRYLSGFVPTLFPLVLIIAGAIMLNEGLRTAVPLPVYKIPLLIVFWISVLSCAGSVVAWIGNEKQRAEDRLTGIMNDEERYHQDRLREVEACDPMTNMVGILVYTDKYHNQELREKALAKIKSNPAWQQELVKLLENKCAIEAFTFLASNEVDDKTLFPAAVNTGISSLAGWVRSSIGDYSHPSHYYSEQFTYETERMLETADKFQGMGVDFLPAVREVRAALDEPNEYNQKDFDCKKMLDRWIKAHQ